MDAKEIYQAVLDDCTTQINQIKKEYGEALTEAICDKISQQYSARIDQLEQQNRELSLQLEKIETKLMNEKTKINPTIVRSRDDLAEMRIMRATILEYDDWRYYVNHEMGNFLYRIKNDWTCKEQVTDYSVQREEAYIRNGKIYFTDCNFQTRSIDIKERG